MSLTLTEYLTVEVFRQNKLQKKGNIEAPEVK